MAQALLFWYTKAFNRNVQLLISEEFAEREIPANDSVRLLAKMVEEMDLRSLFVDGTKLEANANKYTFVWKKSTTKYES